MSYHDDLERSYTKLAQHLTEQYLLVKEKKHPVFKFAKDFYAFHKLEGKTFRKYVNRYKNTKDLKSFVPLKRGPKHMGRRSLIGNEYLEEEILNLRKNGCNKYEVRSCLELKYGKEVKIPSPSTLQSMFKDHGLNKLPKKVLIEHKQKIMKEKLGDLGSIDIHHLPRGLFKDDIQKKVYILGLQDHHSRLSWFEVIEEVTSLEVMFATMKILDFLKERYHIIFKEILSDNGGEFGGGKDESNTMTNPFKRLMYEFNIKLRKTKPYTPQTNGKIERVWRSIEEDMIEGSYYDNLNHFKEEVLKYNVYYNHLRPHQGINGMIPIQLAEKQLNGKYQNGTIKLQI
jgi:Integrase core domain